MTIGFIVFVLGLFGVPLALLAYGHRLRRRTARERNIFWGALIGHCIAGIIALFYGMIPPESWVPENTTRGFFGLWALLLLPVAGAVLGALKPSTTNAAANRG
jgi:hypothetical protein